MTKFETSISKWSELALFWCGWAWKLEVLICDVVLPVKEQYKAKVTFIISWEWIKTEDDLKCTTRKPERDFFNQNCLRLKQFVSE